VRTTPSHSSIWFVLAMILLAPSVAAAVCGGSTPFPQCDDVCPVGQVCADVAGVCGCKPAAVPCTAPGNPDGPPVCYGACPPSQPICATLAGGCACIPTLSEWGVMALSVLMLAGVLTRRWPIPTRSS
jgi:hypothetical protein